MRDDPPGINRYERAQAEPICDYRWMGEVGPIRCLAPATFTVRWTWLVAPPPGECEGVMCDAHIIEACQQLAADPEVEYSSIKLMRHG